MPPGSVKLSDGRVYTPDKSIIIPGGYTLNYKNFEIGLPDGTSLI